MYKKILVPIDGTKRAERVLRHVEQLAIENESDVVVLMATQLKDRKPSEHESQYYIDSLERQKIASESYLSAILNALSQKNVKAKGVIEYGDVIEMIIKIEKDENPDLIAISSHGKKSFGKLLNKVKAPTLFIAS